MEFYDGDVLSGRTIPGIFMVFFFALFQKASVWRRNLSVCSSGLILVILGEASPPHRYDAELDCTILRILFKL